jgi:hypothetical protein
LAFLFVFRRYAPFAEFGFGFEGDHRTVASTSLDATARTTGKVPFARGSIGTIGATSSGTQFSGGGDWVRKLAGRHMSDVTCAIAKKVIGPTSISFSASTAGANPMVPGAPAIDTYVDFRAEWIGSSVRFSGTVRGDDFPNAEVFVVDAKGVGCLLFDGRTTGGQNTGPMTRLAGAHAAQVLGQFSLAVAVTPTGSFIAAKTKGTVTTMTARQVSGAGQPTRALGVPRR